MGTERKLPGCTNGLSQRDERLGWTGDTQIFAATASYNMDTCAFYTKHMKDLRLEQEKLDGGIPFVVPYLKNGFSHFRIA